MSAFSQAQMDQVSLRLNERPRKTYCVRSWVSGKRSKLGDDALELITLCAGCHKRRHNGGT